MAITDFNKAKKLNVEDVTDQPTISRALCLKITSGDDSTTGTGEIVLDWTDIASKADIGVYDENDNLLDYYFESFDDADEKAVIWVFRDWKLDGSTQLQVAYGDGPSDQSVSASTIFDKETDLKAGYLFNEDSGDLLDITSNGNDGTVYGASQGEDGLVGKAYSHDGNDDYISLPASSIWDFFNGDNSEWTIEIDVKTTENGKDDFTTPFIERRAYTVDFGHWIFHLKPYNGKAGLWISDTGSDTDLDLQGTVDISDGNWHHITAVKEQQDVRLYTDNGDEVTGSISYDWSADKDITLAVRRTNDGSKTAYLESSIGSLRITARAVSSDERSALYSAIKSSPDFFDQQAAEEPVSDPEVTTNSASDVTTESATLNGTLDDLGGESSVDVYFEWGEDDSYGNTTSAQSKSSTGSFSETLSLTAGRAYHYRAVVTDGTDTWYGEDQQFITVIPARVYGESRLLADALEWDPSAFYAPPMQTESSLRASVQVGLYVPAPAIRGMAMLKTTGAQAQKVFAAPALSAESRLSASAIFDVQIPVPAIESESRLHAETKVRHWPPELTESQNISTSRRPFAIAYDGRTAFDMGPVRRKDTSEGLYARAWRLRVEGDDCWLAVANEENDEWIEDFIEFPLDDSTGATSFGLTFDQNGRSFVCWEQDGRVWIYYYDPAAEEMTKRDVCAGRTPRARLDVRRDRLSGQSDILLFYLDDDEDCLKYRVQRDRYDDAYAISGFNDVENKYLEILAMASNRRLYLWYSIYDPADDFWVLCCWHSAPYPYVLRDEEITFEGDGIVSAALLAVFKSSSLSEEVETEDSVQSIVVTSVMLGPYDIGDEEIQTDGESVQGAEVTTVISEASLHDDEEMLLDGESVQSANQRVAILEDTLEDEELELNGDSIQSATKQES